MPTFEQLEQGLKRDGYVPVPFSVSRERFKAAIATFVSFLEIPLEVKEPLYFQIHEGDRGSEVGYKRYRREEGKTDNREYVHYHRLAEERFGAARAATPQFDALLHVMREIHDEGVEVLQAIIGEFEGTFPGMYEKFFSKENPGNFYLRFLKYDNAKPGEFLAKGHYDRGSCTLALAESAPGLRMGLDDAHLREVEHKEREALFMAGLTFPNITSKAFVPTWHDVIQKGEDSYSKDIARWAIVLFADANDLPPITYDEAHRPLNIPR